MISQPVPLPAAATTATRRKTVWQQMRAKWYLYALLLPSFVLLIVYGYASAGIAMFESFFDWTPGMRNDFIGLYNYRQVLGDPVFWLSWRNTLIIAAWSFSIPFVIPILVAEALFNLRSRLAKTFYRTAILVPMLVPGIVSLMLWKWLYTYPSGGINLFLTQIGLGDLTRPWLNTQATALPALLFMGFPWIVGTAPLIYLAGLLGIPTDIMDAAKIDGCSVWRRIISIDLPYLTGQIRLFLIFGIIGVIQQFGGQLALTRGGPGTATMVPGLYLYKLAFGLERFERAYTRMGAACAVGVMLFVLILVLSLITNRYTRVTGVGGD